VGYWPIRQLRVLRNRKKFGALQPHKQKTSFSTRHGLILILGVGTFVALVFILVYFFWYLPIEKSMRQAWRLSYAQALTRG
jgi:hypothetical protein